MNTAIRYAYRDGENNKVSRFVIFSGSVTPDDLGRIRASLIEPDDPEDYGMFIPGQVGLPDLQNQFYVESIRMLEEILGVQEGPFTMPLEPEDRKRYENLLAGMRSTKPMWRDDEDHVLHVITDVIPVPVPTTTEVSLDAFIDRLESTDWDLDYLPPFHAEMVENYEKSLEQEPEDLSQEDLGG